MNHKKHAMEVFEIEAMAISKLKDYLDDQFDDSVEAILNAKGKVIICGMGKSGIIGKKIAATMASTGTPSFFMHPGEAYHGDLGMITSQDVFVAISNSGETDELIKLLPFLKDNNNIVIGMSGNPASTLAMHSHFHLNISVDKEACPLQLAPTASTTTTLAMGDALAVALMEARNFKPANFARFHPGGSLGRKLLYRVKDEMVCDNLPTVSVDCNLKAIIPTISNGMLGMAVVLDANKAVVGVITDGDLRRALEAEAEHIFDISAKDFMTKTPEAVSPEMMIGEALELMDTKKIHRLIVIENDQLVGVLRQ